MSDSKSTLEPITKEEFLKTLAGVPHGTEVEPGRHYVAPEMLTKIEHLGFTAKRLIDVVELGYDCLEDAEIRSLCLLGTGLGGDAGITKSELDQFRDGILTSVENDVLDRLVGMGLNVETGRRLMLCSVDFLDDYSRKELNSQNLSTAIIDKITSDAAKQRKRTTIAERFTSSIEKHDKRSIEILKSLRQLSRDDSDIREQVAEILAEIEREKLRMNITNDALETFSNSETGRTDLLSSEMSINVQSKWFSRPIPKHKAQLSTKLLESKYLRKHLGKALTSACVEVVTKKPKDPVEFMGYFLRDYHAKKVARNRAEGKQRKLELRSNILKTTQASAVASHEYSLYTPRLQCKRSSRI